MSLLRKLFFLSRPVQLLFGLLTYGMGLGLARYLGTTLLVEPEFFGGVVVFLLLIISSFLIEYFRPFNEPIIHGETQAEREELRSQLLVIVFAFIAVIMILIFFLGKNGFIRPGSIIILTILILLTFMNAVPPFRLANRGFGELSNSIIISNLSPALAFLLQFGEFHRLLMIFTFPLLLLCLAYFLAIDFQTYSADLKYERKNLLMSITWQNGVVIHNLLLAGGSIFIAAIPFWGVSINLVWPALLVLPVTAYQLILMRNLANGAKPIWPIFIMTATAVFGLTTYLITLTFWLR